MLLGVFVLGCIAAVLRCRGLTGLALLCRAIRAAGRGLCCVSGMRFG